VSLGNTQMSVFAGSVAAMHRELGSQSLSTRQGRWHTRKTHANPAAQSELIKHGSAIFPGGAVLVHALPHATTPTRLIRDLHTGKPEPYLNAKGFDVVLRDARLTPLRMSPKTLVLIR
jgi:hypothetical protein